ncbi:FtsX-like permease family protein [Caldibacillus lycopersici]|uniref:FtsX-like permease family protein n=1 Tax=Perspicuibacillus lycopersici TaxID=1325689 RepID=A0AAE3IUG2_9BACI|nr:ABC transporter permease [Perspicuibacillus lycopersici]MCU9614402.1 FtsX-like permease family protein [Perspicuibacillus lycopersici]
MTFRKFAFNNVLRNKRLYAAYFLSSLFTVMVFFTFSIFAFHPDLNGEDMSASASRGMNIASGIIYVFSFFFILYSMSSFLQSRKKEFGILVMQGMSMKQIRFMVFLENMLLGFFATLGGIGLGVIFAKAILLLAENVLIIDGKLDFYFPLKAIIITFIAFIVLFLCISLFVSYVLRSKKLAVLIKGNKVSRGEPKANLFLVIVTIVLLAIGYATALLAEGVAVVVVMLPVVIVVCIGTYFLFTQLSVFIIRKLKKNERIFWNKTNMLLLSDLDFRMKDNARTFFMVAIVSTVAFSAIGALFGLQSYLTASSKNMNPNTFTFSTMEAGEEQKVALINDTLQEYQIKSEMEHTTLRYYEIGGDTILISKQSDFNRFARLIGENTIELRDGQVVVVEFKGSAYGQTEELMKQTISLHSGRKLKPEEIVYSRALPEVDSYYVVSDNDFQQLPNSLRSTSFYAWQATDGQENILAASKKLYDLVPREEIISGEYNEYRTLQSYGPVLFVGLFIGIVFFVSAGSFLYFRLYMDLDEDKQKFSSIAKMGLTDKELKHVLTRQTMILFFVPIVVALIHGAVALTALSRLFYYSLVIESIVVLGVFLAIQVVYFLIVRHFYTKQIQSVV